MIGVIILNYNTWQETEICVKSIKNHTTIPYKIYIVDNCSKDESPTKLLALYKGTRDIEVILNDQNAGYSAGNNVGIRQAEKEGCEYIFIVNSDVEILNDAFAIMVKTLEQDSNYMMIGPSVVDNNNQETQYPRSVLTPKIFLYGRHPFCLIPYFAKRADRLINTSENPAVFDGSVSGCCFGIRMVDFKDIHYFDENVFLYYEEDILAYKMKNIQKKAVFDKNAKVWHKANVSTKKEGVPFVQFHRWTSVLYLLKTYATISKIQQVCIALWNIFTWLLLSLKSKKYREMCIEFIKKNVNIVTNTGETID